MVGGKRPLSRAQFEPVLRAKHDTLTFALFLQLLGLGYWRNVAHLALDLRQTHSWASSLRKLLLREGTMTPQSWRACFNK